MGLKAMICPNCKGSIAVDEDKQTLKCEYCGTPFLTEDVINYNYTVHKTTIEHVENLTVNDSKSVENQLKSARASYYKLRHYDESFVKFGNVADIDAGDYRGWLGLAITSSAKYLESPKTIQCSCGQEYDASKKPVWEYCVKCHKTNIPHVYDADLQSRIKDINSIKKYIDDLNKIAPPAVKSKITPIIKEWESYKSKFDKIEKMRSFQAICNDMYSKNYAIEKKKDEIKEIDESNFDAKLKYFCTCFSIIFILILLSLTKVMFFIVSAIIVTVVLIFGMVLLGLSKKGKINSLLSEQKELEKTINKLEQEFAARSDKSAFDNINALIQEFSELPESLFEID